jgi:hypothetical protein
MWHALNANEWGLRNIVRIDSEETDERPGTNGWQVRMCRQGQRRTKFFSDEKYGGRNEALEVAMAYRDMIETDMPEPASPVKASKEAPLEKRGAGPLGHRAWRSDESVRSGKLARQPIGYRYTILWLFQPPRGG